MQCRVLSFIWLLGHCLQDWPTCGSSKKRKKKKRCWLLGHCCPCGCKPVPNRLGDWTAEHDVAEGASCSWQAACGQRCDSGVPLWMCLWKAPTKSLPCSRRQTTTRPGLSKAAEVAALHVGSPYPLRFTGTDDTTSSSTTVGYCARFNSFDCPRSTLWRPPSLPAT